METLPPVILGAIISGAFVLIAVLRQPLVGYFVVKEPISSQPKRQFFLDLSLCLLAGLIAATFNTIKFGFPAASAVSLIFGCAVTGFFIAIDMALNRERRIILDALDNDSSLSMPERLFPVTRKFSLVAVATALFVALIIILVISRDIIWLSKIDQTESSLLDAQLS
ncbi:MAG: hypothetical protein NWS07_02485, partial [Desulfobacterales bacterium]|nr:hypothetical protein [Desulfobacterales bacterium]